ncbi:MAG: NAD(P)H-hydrate dehydratase [Lentisphaerae bacterium]|nr:NAD(P)H-hydrate dehydratase [Lentisphaerota bacterium]
MKVVSAEQMRQLDALASADYGVPGEELMERAGRGVALMVDDLARLAGFSNAPVRLVAGRGNNGGDVFVAARHLHDMGYRLDVWLAGERRRVSGHAAKHLELMRTAGINVEEVPTPQDWEELTATYEGGQGVVVDGVLGTGLRGPARGLAAGAIQFVNMLGESGPVVAVDIPSGLDADTGAAEADTVRADLTVTMGLPKRGLVAPQAVEYVGSAEVIDIGIPDEVVAKLDSDLDLTTAMDARDWLPRRPRASHKGDYGHALVVAGAAGYAGAAILAARAAIRSGVGLVTVLVPEGIAGVVASAVPEAMVHAVRQSASGSPAGDALTHWGRRLQEFDAVLVGPGITACEDSRGLVTDLLKTCRGALVLDADALNVLGTDVARVRESGAHVVVTPHPGEMARLLGVNAAAVQADRFATARRAAEALGAVVVLKGAGTLVAAKGQPLSVNLTGNPGMACGGMGDVLAGLLTGLLAQRIPPFAAARLAAYLHGRAGDRVAWTTSQAGMTAGDVVDAIAHGFSDLTLR